MEKHIADHGGQKGSNQNHFVPPHSPALSFLSINLNLQYLVLLAIPRGERQQKRYVGATVFADHFSGLTYVHLMSSLSGDETVEAKQAFERFAAQHGVHVSHYHADNGRFADLKFMEAVKTSHQTLSFCGVGAHHQNGIAERRIRDITETSRTMLLHAQHRWPNTVTCNLWPQALKQAVNIRNALTREMGKSSPLSIFSNTEVQPNLQHFHPFGCPVDVLDAALQGAGMLPRSGKNAPT